MTKRELAFCEHYVQSRSLREAARQAGYSSGWVNRAYQIYDRPHVRERIAELSRQVQERAVTSGAEVVNEIAKVAFLDVASFMKEDPSLPGCRMWKAPDELTDEQRACIAQIHVSDYEFVAGQDDDGKDIVEIRQSYTYQFHDKMNALEKLGKHFQIFGDSHTTNINLNRFSSLPEDVLHELEEKLAGVLEGEYTVMGEEDGPRLLDDRRSRH